MRKIVGFLAFVIMLVFANNLVAEELDIAVQEKIKRINKDKGLTKSQKKALIERYGKQKIYLSAPSFVNGRLLSDIVVPVTERGTITPVPVIIRLTNISKEIDFVKANLRNCFLLAEVKGDLSTSKALFRLNKLSCVDNEGQSFTRGVSGYIMNSDETEGIVGRVVARQEAILSKVYKGAFLGNIGKSFQDALRMQSVLGINVSAIQDINLIWQAGLGVNFAEAITRLSEVYDNGTEQMVSVIEVDAGRDMKIVFTSQIELSPDENIELEEAIEKMRKNNKE